MNIFDKKFNLIVEELTDGQKEYVDTFTAKRAKTLSFGPMFKDERTYFPIKKTNLSILKTPEDILDVVDKAGYYVNDYRDGYVYKKDDKLKSKPVKLIKVLSKELKNDADKFNMLKKKFDERLSTSRKANIECLICITHNPYDVAGMSTDRNWRSCMELEVGAYCKTPLKQVQYGGMCAYLIKKDDKDIKEPIARIAIKRLTARDTRNAFIFVSEQRIYGDVQFAEELDFNNQINQILEQSNKQTMKSAMLFKRKDGNSYSDSRIEDIIKFSNDDEKIQQFKQKVEKSIRLKTYLQGVDWQSIFESEPDKCPEKFLIELSEYLDWEDWTNISSFLPTKQIIELFEKNSPIIKYLQWFAVLIFHRDLPDEFLKKNLNKIIEITKEQKANEKSLQVDRTISNILEQTIQSAKSYEFVKYLLDNFYPKYNIRKFCLRNFINTINGVPRKSDEQLPPEQKAELEKYLEKMSI